MRPSREVNVPERRAAYRRRARWGRFRRWGLGAAALGLPFAVLPADQAKSQALPTGGNVVGGSGTISQTSANQLTINQNSATLSIDWQSFSVGAGNIVRFIQPDSSSLALNRVIGPDPSMIFGSIQANGRVVIMNPAGIYFGPSAMVDVNGLVATTSRMNQADFLAGNLNFSIAGDVNARVINEGFVNVAQGGFAVLSAAAVENKGTIVAQGGTVVLAGTPTFTLDFFGDGLLKFASTGTVNQAPAGANALVENSGTVQANGGRVLMTARAARDVINNVINVTGIVEARSARIENGEIVIDGGENGTTVIAGRLDVSGNEADAKGGNVTVLGGRVELAAGTDIRASGEAGGGTVLAGGGQHGQGTAYNARTLYMDAAAVIDANATLNGKGGKVVLWADDTTRMEGTITARGGTIAGDGGFVETSGKNRITFANTVAVDTRAFNGRDGMLLIDPNEFNIAPFGADMSAAVLVGLLATNDITIDSNTGATAGSGHINVSDAITYTGAAARTLTFNAVGTINLDETITATNGALNLVLQAGGNVSITSAITTNNGYLLTQGRDGVGALGGSFQNFNSGSISLGTGALTLNTTGGISFNSGVTTSGTVTLNAGGAVTQTYAITGGANLVIGGTGAVTLNESTNALINITLNRTGTTTDVSLVNSSTPIVQTSTLGTGSFYLSGVGFAQTGTITQDALADSFTIQGNSGIVTLSQANVFTGDVTVLADAINVTANQSFNIATSANLNLISTSNIVIDKSLIATGAGSMNMIFNARSGGGATGYIDIQPTNSDIVIDTNGGYIVMGGGTGSLTNALPGAAQAAIGGGGIDQGISIQGYNDGTARSVTITTDGGNFFARGRGATSGTAPAGIYLYTTAAGGAVTISAGAGNININGTGGFGNDGSGVFMQGNSGINTATLQTTTGNITVSGTSGSGASSHGILAAYFSEIETGSGTLTLNGGSVGSGFSRGVWSLGVIDAGSGAGSSIIGTSVVEYGILAMPGADWRVANSTLTVGGTSVGAGAAGVGLDGIVFSAGSGTIDISGEGGSGGNAINLSGAITLAGDAVNLVFNGTGAAADIVVSAGGTITTTSATGTRNVSLISDGNINIQGTPSTVAIGATAGGMLNFSAQAADTLTLGGKIVTEGGNVSLVAGTKATINAGIETFGGDISIWGNAPGGTPSATPSAGLNVGVNLQRTSATAVTIDAGGGDISIAGAGGNGGTYSHGVLIDGVVVQTSGTGAIEVTGKGGASAGGAEQVGVYINGDTFLSSVYSPGTALVSGSGGITITGYGALTGTGGSNIGVRIARATVSATNGDVAITGTGGAGSNSDSIEIAGASVTSTGTGSILLSGLTPIGTGTGIDLRDSYDGASTTVVIGGASFQGDLHFTATSLASSVSTLTLSRQSGGGTIQFENVDSSLGIGVNGGFASGGIAITAGILGGISGFDTLMLGSAGQLGSIQVDNTQFWSLASGVSHFAFQTQGTFVSNTMEFSGQAVTIDAGGAASTTILGATTATLSGQGDVTAANIVADAIALDKSGTTANVTLASSGSMTLAASTMGSGSLSLNATAGITQTGALVQDANGGSVTINSTGTIILSQTNEFTGATVSIQGGSLQITGQQNFTRGVSQNVNLTSTAGNVLVGGNLVKSSGTGGATFFIDAEETAWFANAGIDTDGGNINVWGNAPGGDNNAGTNAGTAWGVRIDGASAILSAGSGNVMIIGKGSTDNGTGQHGIVMLSGGRIETTSGNIVLGGRGGAGTGAGAQGIIVAGGSQIETQSGYIELYGYGGANSATAHGISVDGAAAIVNAAGVYVTFNGQAANGGTGIIAVGTATVEATTGQIGMISNNGIALNSAVVRSGAGATFDGGTGAVALNNLNNAFGGTISIDNYGNASIATSGTMTLDTVNTHGGSFTADAADGLTITSSITTTGGNINLYGNAPGGGAFGASSTAVFGVSIDSASALVDAGGGDIFIKGAGGSGAGGSHGVTIRNGAGVLTSGTGTLTIEGQGGNSAGGGAAGVEFYASGAYAQTQHGVLTVTGTGGANGSGNIGVALATGAIRATGTGAVTVTGAGGGLASVGVHVGGGGTTSITTVDGNLTINATGGGANDSGIQSRGLEVGVNQSGVGQLGTIGATGTGSVSITATAGGASGDSNRYGIIVGSGGGIATQVAGISITATGGTGGGTNNHAVYLDSGSINSGGALTLNAISGNIAGQTGTVAAGGNTSLTTTAGDIDWVQSGGMTIGSISSAGTLNVSVTGGSISQVGAATVAGASSFTAGGDIILTNASNAFGGALSISTAAGAVSVTNPGNLTLGGVTAGNGLTVVTGGSISQVGAATVTGTSSFTTTGGSITLTNASNAFGGALSLTATAGSASVTNSGALTLGDMTVGGALTVTAGGALTQLGASFFSAGSTSLSATGTMTLTESGNDFGTSLSLTGTGGALDGTVNGNSGAAAAPAVTASSGSFTFGGATVSSSAPPPSTPTEGTTTNTVTTETLAQIITQILTSTVVQPSSSTTGTTDAANVNPVSPAAVQAMLIAILTEAASPAGSTGGGQQGSGEGNNPQTAGSTPQTGGAQSSTPTPSAGAGTFAAGTTITINTSGGAVQSITVTPVGGGAPVTILPGLLNLTPPAIPTATATGTPGISGNFPLAWGGR
ncbi:MAG: hypothetical protein C6Y20_08260 [Tagaea sp. CACIAM 22H2]|nr:hypothetical protein [Tagaea sp. CACIAM 22H2]